MPPCLRAPRRSFTCHHTIQRAPRAADGGQAIKGGGAGVWHAFAPLRVCDEPCVRSAWRASAM
eukprot:6702522-Prymnesium_polylepis.1